MSTILSQIRELGVRANHPTVIGAWVADANDDPYFKQFLIVAYHLRDYNNKNGETIKANKAKSRMTHELVIFPVRADVDFSTDQYPDVAPIVVPPEMNLQFRAQNDQNAMHVLRRMIEVVKLNGMGVTKKWDDHWVYVLSNATNFDVFKAKLEQ